MQAPMIAKILKKKGVLLKEPEQIIIHGISGDALLVQRSNNILERIFVEDYEIESLVRIQVGSPLAVQPKRRLY